MLSALGDKITTFDLNTTHKAEKQNIMKLLIDRRNELSSGYEAKNNYRNLQLHMLGALQSNKAKRAVKLFDYIHSLDNQKLADTLKKHEINFNKQLKYFIQVNIGNESQKSGVPVQEVDPFYNYCKKLYLI